MNYVILNGTTTIANKDRLDYGVINIDNEYDTDILLDMYTIPSPIKDIDSISKMKEEDNGINIYVGSETELTDDVSVIKTKYNIDGTEGTIAIIGPKRMEYDRVVTLLDYIKNNLGGQSGKEE